MKYRTLKLDYIPSEKNGITGVKEKNMKDLSNIVGGGYGTFIESTSSELILTLIDEENNLIEIDVKKQLLPAIGRKNLGEKLEFDLFVSMPQYVEIVEKGNSYRLSNNSVKEWKANFSN
ncbi:hypothetical protein [Bacillus sp. FJAT-29814]|uniref:hypothetical protein n=1 Tax=Bacillus sp. FJAT-29814 TaxID=1729688 RepID=UPI0008352C51|nr:hypothetical protein [Bacillus sp. FJAT-29814]